MYSILRGLRIVETSAFVAAPIGGMTLAQLGADVIRCDPPGGGIDTGRWPLTRDGRSLYWAGLNKGKRSVAVDVRRPEGRDLVAALITAEAQGGGLFLTNLPARAPLDHPTLRERRRDVIAVEIVGHRDGATAVDYTVNAAVGVPFATGPARPDAPVNNMLAAWDLLTGLTAATGLLAAERHRRETGDGQRVRLALSDVAYAAVGTLGHIGEAQVNDTQRAAHGNDIYGAFGRDFPTRDGRRVMVAAISRRQWESLVEATGTGQQMRHVEAMLGVDLADEGERYAARDLVAPLIARWVSAYTLAEVRAAFDTHGVCWGPYQTFLQMVREDPRCSTENPLFQEVDQPGIGRYLMPGSPLDLGAFERQPVRPAPVLGQHTDEVLAEVLGLGDGNIGALHDRGVVAGPRGRA